MAPTHFQRSVSYFYILSVFIFSSEGPCVADPCQNNGACFEHSSGDGFACACAVGWTGELCIEGKLN